MSTRHLAAIMFTDIAGYTAVMQEDEQLARTYRDRHRKVLQDFHKEFGGEIIQYYGDGTLSIFSSGIQAVRCAREMQLKLIQEPHVPVRIGLHTGDIVREESGIYGDSVNVASRIESLSVPGAVMISGKLADEVKNQKDIRLQSMGQFNFKNVAKEIEVFALSNYGLEVPDKTKLEGKFSFKQKSIAVLPFVNMSADPENEFFSEGISEEILNALAKLDFLQVTARTSSFAFKGKNVDIREIGRTLHVNSILEGSVRKAGKRVRITAQLINTSDGYHVWSETYDRNLEDIFAVQDEVTHKIVEKLKANFSEKTHANKLVEPHTDNLVAYEKFLKANYNIYQLTPDSLHRAKQYAEEAIEEDPAFSYGYMVLIYAYMMLGEGDLIPTDIVNDKVTSLIQKIISIGGDHALIYTAIASRSIIFENQLEPAGSHLKRALKLNPNDVSAHILSGLYHLVIENWDQMLYHFRKVKSLDPMNPASAEMLSWGYFHIGDDQRAKQICLDLLDRLSDHRQALETLGHIYNRQGNYQKALEYQLRIPSEMGLRMMRSSSIGHTYGLMGAYDKAQSCLNTIADLKAKHGGYRYDLNMALVYLGMKDYDKFFDHWETGLKHSAPSAIFFFPFPAFSDLKNNPRYIALKKKYLPWH